MKRLFAASPALATVLSLSLGYSADSGKRGEFLSPSELAELGEKSKVGYATKIVKSAAELPAIDHPGVPKDGPVEETRYPEISVGSDGSRAMNSYQPTEADAQAMKEADRLFRVTRDYVVLLGPERQEEITQFVERFVFQK